MPERRISQDFFLNFNSSMCKKHQKYRMKSFGQDGKQWKHIRHWCGLTYMVVRLSDISSKTGKKCIFGVFRLFLGLCRTASQPYRLSHFKIISQIRLNLKKRDLGPIWRMAAKLFPLVCRLTLVICCLLTFLELVGAGKYT